MPDPVTFTASAIAELAFQAFLKSGVGELSKRFTQEAIKKISQLHSLIWNKLRGSPDASKAIQSVKDGAEEDLNDVVTYLKSAMKNDTEFASQVQALTKEINAGKLVDQGNMNESNVDHNNIKNKSEEAKIYQNNINVNQNTGNMHFGDNYTYHSYEQNVDD